MSNAKSHATTIRVVSMKHKTRLDAERIRALAILAENPDGCSLAIMLARGFSLSLLNRLVRAGLASSHIAREERAK